ncbi:MAG: biopolymer transporter ExbD [Gammaproteobacteria bacterium]|nr:biopolymer transporter ExbD [Gammaproteobacteria bacterium]
MHSDYRRRSRAGLNLTPLIDIVFLLLIFFMLTAHFVQEETLDIELPEAETAAADEDESLVEVILSPEGELRVDGQVVPPERLEEALRGALHAPGRKSVRLRGDDAARFGRAVMVIDAARKAGAESLDILTEQP